MKRFVNKEELKVEWHLNKWYEKLAYVIGVGSLFIYTLGFFVGVLQGILEA